MRPCVRGVTARSRGRPVHPTSPVPEARMRDGRGSGNLAFRCFEPNRHISVQHQISPGRRLRRVMAHAYSPHMIRPQAKDPRNRRTRSVRTAVQRTEGRSEEPRHGRRLPHIQHRVHTRWHSARAKRPVGAHTHPHTHLLCSLRIETERHVLRRVCIDHPWYVDILAWSVP